MIELEMLVGLSGNEYSLSPGDKHHFPGEVVDGKITGEAGRLIEAGYAKIPTLNEVDDEDKPNAARKRRQKAS